MMMNQGREEGGFLTLRGGGLLGGGSLFERRGIYRGFTVAVSG